MCVYILYLVAEINQFWVEQKDIRIRDIDVRARIFFNGFQPIF